LNTIINKIFDSLNRGNILLAFVIIALAMIWKHKKIMEFISTLKKNQIVKLSEALDCKYIQGLTRTHLEEELAAEHFKRTMGIVVKKECREALIQAYSNTKWQHNFSDFKEVIPYMVYKDNVIKIRIPKIERLTYGVNIFVSSILTLFGLSLLIYVTYIKTEHVLDSFVTGTIFIGVAFFMLYQTRPYILAKKVASLLKKNKDEGKLK